MIHFRSDEPPDAHVTVRFNDDSPHARPCPLPCACVRVCGDDGDTEGPGTCKGLPLPRREPLVEIVLVDRRRR